MEILTGKQMRNVDRRAIDAMGIPSLELMEAAGRGVAERVRADFPTQASGALAIVCGKGNNGGDGFVTARHLAAAGARPQIYLLTTAREVSGDAKVNLERVRATGLTVHEVPDDAAWERVRERVVGAELVIDAILGTGVRGGARGLAARVIRDLDRAGTLVASIDLPSGLDADSAKVEGPAVRARRTYTLCRPKVPLALEPAAAHSEGWVVVPIGIPDEAVAAERALLEWIDAPAVAGLLARRPVSSHKGTYGHLLAVAGSLGKAGAAVLLARAALRSGVGLVTVATPAGSQPVVAAQQAEVMVEPLPETTSGTLSRVALDPVRALLERADALAIGPGLGVDEDTRELVTSLVREARQPAVLDADGLNVHAPEDRAGPELRAGQAARVLTPHPGEAARLLRSSTSTVQSDRSASAGRLAEESGAVVVLKGHRTLVADPDGRLAVNSTGNPGMASAGSGDVLTGVIGSLLARGLPARDAARLGVFLHGDAGDRAAERIGQEGLIASDIIDRLPAAMQALTGSGETD